jgi:uncharacterized membrane protein YdjX (TVP38/TMEM64 family)
MARVQWGRWLVLAVYLSALAGVALAWRDPVWHRWLEPQVLGQLGRELLASPLGPLAVIGGYVLAVVMAMPVLLLVSVGSLVFGPWPGMAYALIGMVAGSVVTYGFGWFTGAQTMDRFTQGRLALLASHLQNRGLLTVMVIRVMPVAPFIMVNLVAGALRVKLRDYVLGTALGLLPATVLISLFMTQLKDALENPGLGALLSVLVALLVVAVVFLLLRRKLRRQSPSH